MATFKIFLDLDGSEVILKNIDLVYFFNRERKFLYTLDSRFLNVEFIHNVLSFEHKNERLTIYL